MYFLHVRPTSTMKTATFVAAILAVIGTTFSIAEAKPAGIFDTDRELHREISCPTFVERYAERDAVAEEDVEGVLTGLVSSNGNVVAKKMLEMMQRKAERTACIFDACNAGTFEPGDCRPDDDETRRRALRRHGGGGRGGFGGGRRGGIEELCDNLDAADEVLDALIGEFGNPFETDVGNKPARRAITMLTVGTMMCPLWEP